MPNVLVNDTYLINIADAIREKNGTETTYKPSEMADAISAIEAGSAEPVIEALNITVNGEYIAPEGLDGYNPITVDVPSKEPVVESITITANGTYTVPEGIDGYNPVIVDIDIPTGDIPEEALNITGDCDYRFANNGWNWFINLYGSTIKTENIQTTSRMFMNCNFLQNIPFDINFKETGNYGNAMSNTFYGCSGLLELPKVNYAKPTDIASLFDTCRKIKYIPDDFDSNWDWSYIDSLTTGYSGPTQSVFHYNSSLRRLPINMMKHGNPNAVYSYSWYYNMCYDCYSLDEIVGLPFPHYNATWTSNAFRYTFNTCYRLKEITFALQEDGTPYSMNWSKQTIDLTKYVGYANVYTHLTDLGFTMDECANSDAKYQALKDNPNWWSVSTDYSRYNHNSAVNTINSLPITTGTGNTVKFKGASGALTDGGAINTLTEEEIAVATAKGWTVSLV